MILRPGTLALTALLAVLTSLGPLSTDMYLPSLPAIALAFEGSTARVQLTLSVFLLGFAAGQIFYGPFADRHGRKPVLIAGLVLFTIGSLLCAAATSLEMLIAARFLQAVGASGPVVLARSIVRDLYTMERAGAELARMGMIMGLVPALAPIAGGVLENAHGWRANFLASTLFGLATLAAVALALPETLKARAGEPVSPRRIGAIVAELARHDGFRGYTAIACCTYGGLFAFISGSSFVLQGVYDLSPLAFGMAFGAGVLGYITGTIAAQHLLKRRGIEGTMGLGITFLMAGGLGLFAGTAFGIGHVAEVLIPITLYTFGLGLTMPQAIAGAMIPFPDRAGAASSLLGVCQMTFAAAVGIAVGHALGDRAWPLGLAVALLGAGAFIAYRWTASARRESLARARG